MKKELVFRLVLAVSVFLLVYQFGVKPVINREFYLDLYKKDNWAADKLVKEKGLYDVIVVGEEPEGVAAAVSAARTGASVLLLSQSGDVGGIVPEALYTEFRHIYGTGGNLLSKGFFWELMNAMGADYSVENYRKVLRNIIKAEKNLETVYDVKNLEPVMEKNILTGIKGRINGTEKIFQGKRFIDATWKGEILAACGVPYFNGSEDLNLKGVFSPVRLNFELEGADYKSVKNVIDLYNVKFYSIIGKYKPSSVFVKVRNFGVADNGSGRIIVKGLEILKLDPEDEKAMTTAYKEASAEAKTFAEYLSRELEVFKNARFLKAADRFVVPEDRHFTGEVLLTVEDILENRDFEGKIAMGASRVEGGKFVDNEREYIIGKPSQYGIPLGCLIPHKVENLLMVGGKISYSSLASSSAAELPVNIATGQAAGVVAVYSITNDVSAREMVRQSDSKTMGELQKLLKKQGVYLPRFNMENKNASSWCYSDIKKLATLGLITGGVTNNYRLDKEANMEDLGYILLNGVYRLDPGKYNFDFDAGIRPYIKKEKLTKEKAAQMLLAFHGEVSNQGDLYDRACRLGYIDELAQIRLKNKERVTFDLVYHLGAYNIRMYTGKDIP